jgi:hypothetical protein
MKRMRNTCIRAKGMMISGVLITPQVLKRHLSTLPETTALTHHRIERLLSPNDKQDVTWDVKLAYDLLSAIASLPPAGSEIPTVQTTRQSLRLLGCIHAHVLETFTSIDLSLHEQLVHLSALAHLYLAIYSVEKNNYVLSQLYIDVQTWIKNAFFCVAKTKLDDPDGQFWLILLGTDALEHLFGVVRTMISTDANADLPVLQLGNRLGAAATCCCILAEHPEWVRGPRRLSIRNWRDDPGNINWAHSRGLATFYCGPIRNLWRLWLMGPHGVFRCYGPICTWGFTYSSELFCSMGSRKQAGDRKRGPGEGGGGTTGTLPYRALPRSRVTLYLLD